jgi:signal transduction histidine kinase
MSVRDIDSPQIATQFEEKIQQLLQVGSAVLDTEHRTKDGRILSIELSSRVVTLDNQTVVLSVARDVTERKRQQAEILARNEQIAALNAVIAERDRISREMHDSLAQMLAYVRYKAHALRDALLRGEYQQVETGLGQLEEAADAAYSDVRATILDLRTAIVPDGGLIASLRNYSCQFEQEWHIKTVLVVEGKLPHFAPATDIQLLRIIQEAMSNVRKHSGAQHVTIRVARSGECTIISVEDDGKGFDPILVEGLHFGLATMRERAQQVNAQLEIDSHVGAGTIVRICLPSSACLEEGGDNAPH